MMSNKEVAKLFQELARLMEFHGENPFKIRSYNNAYVNIRRLPKPILEMPTSEISDIKGIGKAIAGKLEEIKESGTFKTLERFRDQTPEGIAELLNIKGLGAKKVRVIHDQLGVASIGELLYACNENRLIELKGFGAKTQKQLTEQLNYIMAGLDMHLYWHADEAASAFEKRFSEKYPEIRLERTGALRRRLNTISTLEFISSGAFSTDALSDLGVRNVQLKDEGIVGTLDDAYELRVLFSEKHAFGMDLFKSTGPETFVQAVGVDIQAASEEEVFKHVGLPFAPPEMRDLEALMERMRSGDIPDLITADDIRGVVHAHSTYSDGLHSLKEMAEACRERGFEYLVITDHSKAAFYANGLTEDRLELQWREIDGLNEQWTDFRIFKGIESDILSDGSLDYADDVLAGFEFIIASVHSNLRMDEEKANRRLITAIENPHTTMLGHPTGRLLLSRKGYPIDHKKIIDACAANGVMIEVNANPYRLDLDWRWIEYALNCGIKLSINPDAHSTAHIDFIKYGVYAARKGGLTPSSCLNALSLEDFQKQLYQR